MHAHRPNLYASEGFHVGYHQDGMAWHGPQGWIWQCHGPWIRMVYGWHGMDHKDGYGKMSCKMQEFWTECEEFDDPLIGRQACISYLKDKPL